jgi:hypothetical protein
MGEFLKKVLYLSNLIFNMGSGKEIYINVKVRRF